MSIQEGKRFRRSFCGYNRVAVDAEFNRLLSQNEAYVGERESLQTQINTLNEDKNFLSREQSRLNTALSSTTGQIVELETTLSQAKAENNTLVRAIDAHKAENNALQIRCDQLKERDRDFAMREREFAELQGSVSSIMSVTKRATDRLFQKVVDNQERVTQIAGDAAREVAAIRSDMVNVRQQLNEALDQVQDRIDRVDASLTGAVHKLVAIKHDDGLQTGDNQPDILSEVERLLSIRAGDTDGGYPVPALGPYSAKFVADTAQRVSDGRIMPKPAARDGVEVRRTMPSNFNSTEDSILEANNLIDRGGITAAEYYKSNPQFVPPARPEEPPALATAPAPPVEPVAPSVGFGFEEAPPAAPSGEAIPLGTGGSNGYASRIGFSPDFGEADGSDGDAPSVQYADQTGLPDNAQRGFGFTPDRYDGQDEQNEPDPGDDDQDEFAMAGAPDYPPAQFSDTGYRRFDSAPSGNDFFEDGRSQNKSEMFIGNHNRSAAGSYECYPVRSYSFQPYEDAPANNPQSASEAAPVGVRPRVCRKKAAPKKVAVHIIKK